jgi:hypothetical protein
MANPSGPPPPRARPRFRPGPYAPERYYDLGFAKFAPNARLEYQRHFERADDAALGYADQTTTGPGYTVTTAPAQRSRELAELGGKLIRGNRQGLIRRVRSSLVSSAWRYDMSDEPGRQRGFTSRLPGIGEC